MSVPLPRVWLGCLLLANVVVTAVAANLPLSKAAPTTVTHLRSLFLSGQVDAARASRLNCCLRQTRVDARSLALLGDILFRQSKFSDAEQAYRSAVDADENYARGHWGLGRLEMLASHRTAAREHISRAFQLDPRDPDIVLAFADFVQDAGSRVVAACNRLACAGTAMKSKREWRTPRRGLKSPSAWAAWKWRG